MQNPEAASGTLAPIYAIKAKVLVVDDARTVADTLTSILNLHEFEATALYSGEAALEWIEANRPDIVLSDIRMRKVSGIETATRVRDLHPECRVVLFTASPLSRDDQQKIEELGFPLLDRPLHPRQVLAFLRNS